MISSIKISHTEKLNTTRNFRYFDFLPGNFKLPRDRSLPNFCISWIKKFWQWQGIRCHFASIDFKQICHPFQQGNFFLIAFDALKGEKTESRVDLLPWSELGHLVRTSQANTWAWWKGCFAPGLALVAPRSSSFWAREVMAKRTSDYFPRRDGAAGLWYRKACQANNQTGFFHARPTEPLGPDWSGNLLRYK